MKHTKNLNVVHYFLGTTGDNARDNGGQRQGQRQGDNAR